MQEFEVRANPNMRVATGIIGSEEQPIILVEDFIQNAEELVEHIASNQTFIESEDYYPGIRSMTPYSYMDRIQQMLGAFICKTFAIDPKNISHADSFLSIVTTPPNELMPAQRIPHFDGTNPEDIAFLHYLCDEKFGGTSFYRHKASGYEYVNGERYPNYMALVKEESQNPDPIYMNGSTAYYDRIDTIEAHFNRLIIYRGTSLHSGNIDPDYLFDPDPRSGRLTITSFLYSKQDPK